MLRLGRAPRAGERRTIQLSNRDFSARFDSAPFLLLSRARVDGATHLRDGIGPEAGIRRQLHLPQGVRGVS
jgi:hypothetical protein